MSGKMQLSYAICKGNVPVGASAVAVRAVLAWSHSVHTVIQGAAQHDGIWRIGRQVIEWRCAAGRPVPVIRIGLPRRH